MVKEAARLERLRRAPGLTGEALRAALPALATGLALRLLFIAWTSPLTLSLDEGRFWDLATRWMADTAFIPPLYPLYLAVVRAVLGDSVTAVRIFGACLSLFSVLLVFALAERHLGKGEGRVPAWIMAAMPTLVYYDGRLRSESLYILLLLVVAWLWTAKNGRPGWLALMAGVPLGLATLVRPEAVVLLAVLALLGMRKRGATAVVRAAFLLPGLLLVVGPWSARNEILLGIHAPVSTNGGYNFWKSFNPMTDGSQIPVTDLSMWEGVAEEDMDAVGYREGWRFIRAHPVRSLFLVPAKWAHLFGPERDFLSDIRRHQVPRRAPGFDLGIALFGNACWFLLLGLGLVALAGPSGGPVKEIALAVLLMLLAVHAVFFGDDRFHVPLIPFLCIVLPEAWDGSAKPTRLLRVIGLLLAAEGVFWMFIVARDLGRIGSIWGTG